MGPEMIEDLKKEIDVLKELEHKHIVRYLGCFERDMYKEDEGFAMFMEYVSGGSVMSFSETLPNNLLQKYGKQILLGVQYLHSKNVIHCDLNPNNILLTKEGMVKISDFGLSKKGRTGFGTDGTRKFQAPEIFRGLWNE